MEIKSRRSSRRIRGLAPQADVSPPQAEVPPPKAVYLPPELKLDVLARLRKRDLKSVRLVSKEWNALAMRPLFDRVYISCRAKDIEVFSCITRHPVISMGITELVYDASFFKKDIDFEEYFNEIFENVYEYQRLNPNTSFDSADIQINTFVEECGVENTQSSDLYEDHKKDTFLLEGYRKYRDYSAFEQLFIESRLLFDDLCNVFGSLRNLRSLVLSQTIWDSAVYETDSFGMPAYNTLRGSRSGSPLCRSWNPFHLRPAEWHLPPNVDESHSQLCAHFRLLTNAIGATNKDLTSFKILDDGTAEGLPQRALIKSNLTDSDLWCFMRAYSGLKCLEIGITTDDPNHRNALTVLPELLAQMRGLRRLSLRLVRTLAHPLGRYYRYDEIFPVNGVWPELTELSLSGLAIGGWDLMMLTLSRARIRKLELSRIDLLDSRWEAVIEGMHRWEQLTELHMSCTFKHCGGAIFAPDSRGLRTDWAFLLFVERYVIYGGRHPSLTPEQDPEIARRWYLDMLPQDFIDQTKFAMHEIRYGQDVDKLFRYRK